MDAAIARCVRWGRATCSMASSMSAESNQRRRAKSGIARSRGGSDTGTVEVRHPESIPPASTSEIGLGIQQPRRPCVQGGVGVSERSLNRGFDVRTRPDNRVLVSTEVLR